MPAGTISILLQYNVSVPLSFVCYSIVLSFVITSEVFVLASISSYDRNFEYVECYVANLYFITSSSRIKIDQIKSNEMNIKQYRMSGPNLNSERTIIEVYFKMLDNTLYFVLVTVSTIPGHVRGYRS